MRNRERFYEEVRGWELNEKVTNEVCDLAASYSDDSDMGLDEFIEEGLSINSKRLRNRMSKEIPYEYDEYEEDIEDEQ